MDAQGNGNIATRGEESEADATVTIPVETKQSNIPLDMIHDIILKFPMKSLLRLKAICKPWCSLICDPPFIKSHIAINQKNTTHHNVSYIHLSKDDYDDGAPGFSICPSWPTVSFTSIVNSNEASSEIRRIEIDYPFNQSRRCQSFVLGSCNGLLLIVKSKLSYGTLQLEKAGKLCQQKMWERYSYIDYVSGLGYDSLFDEYKAVIFFGRRRCRLFIFSSRTGYWKDVDGDHDLQGSINETDVFITLGLTENGAPHWELSNRTIIYFDMREEKFKKLSTPKMSWWNDRYLNYDMAILNGCLCIVRKKALNFEFWAMTEYGAT